MKRTESQKAIEILEHLLNIRWMTKALLDKEWMTQATPDQVAAVLEGGITARDKRLRTPLHRAARHNQNPKVLALILDRGADINARDERRRTPLHCATRHNQQPEVLALLLDRGADINARDDRGKTPLLHAVQHYSREQFKLPPGRVQDSVLFRHTIWGFAVTLTKVIEPSG